MKAVYFTESLGNGSKGGGSLSSLDFLDCLLDNYSEVEVYHLGSFHNKNLPFKAQRVSRHLSVRKTSLRNVLRWIFYFLVDFRYRNVRIEHVQNDHLFVNSWPSCFHDLSVKVTSKRVILIMRGSVGFFSKSTSSEVQQKIYNDYKTWMEHYSDIIFVSRNIIAPWQDFLDWQKGVFYLPNTVDSEIIEHVKDQFPKGYVKDGINIVLVGSVQSRKNQAIIKLAADYFSTNRMVRFHIVGPISKSHGGIDIVKNLGNCTNVLFHGFQSNVRPFISGASICLLTSLAEASPRSLLSYIKLGKLVVSSNVDGNSEIIIDNRTGYLFNPEDGNELIEKLKLAINGRGQSILRKNAIAHYKLNYSKENQLKIFKEIFASIC